MQSKRKNNEVKICIFVGTRKIMTQEAIKLELIEWLTKLDNDETIGYLKVIKDETIKEGDWWNSLSESQKSGIERGLKDIDEGRTVPHETVKLRYGL